MSLLIDGYNLLHASGILPSSVGPGTLERARRALLNYLVSKLSPEEIAGTTVVFDAQSAPPGLPKSLDHRGLLVLFADKDQEADDLIEELIRSDSAPRRLTVVSSDHRIQRAAHRRRAQAIDSDQWCREFARRVDQPSNQQLELTVEKPMLPLSQKEVEDWLILFGDTELPADASEFDNTAPTAAELSEKRNQCSAYLEAEASAFPEELADDLLEEMEDDRIFPPGYGEDLLE